MAEPRKKTLYLMQPDPDDGDRAQVSEIEVTEGADEQAVLAEINASQEISAFDSEAQRSAYIEREGYTPPGAADAGVPAADAGTGGPVTDERGQVVGPLEPDVEEPPPATPAPVPPLRSAAGGGSPGPLQAQPPPDGYGSWLGDVGQTATDFGRSMGGLVQGAIPAAVGAMLPTPDDGTGIPREYAAGSAAADMTDQVRRDQADAEARSPLATGAARGLSTAAQVIPVTAAMAPASAAAPLATMAAPAVALGALTRGASAVDPRSGVGQQMGEAFDPEAVAFDATLGVGLPAAAQTAGDITAGMAAPLRTAGHWMRGQAGGYGGLEAPERAALSSKLGAPGATGLGAEIERQGLPAASRLPMSKASYAQAAGDRAQALGPQLGATLDRAGASGASVPVAAVQDELMAARSAIAPGRGASGRGTATQRRELLRTAREDIPNATGGMPATQITPRQLHQIKTGAEADAGYRPGELMNERGTALKQASDKAAGIYRGQLRGVMNGADEGMAFGQLNSDIGRARAVQDTATGAAGGGGLEGRLTRAVMSGSPTAAASSMVLPLGADMAATGFKGAAGALQGTTNALDASAPALGPAAGSYEAWLGAGRSSQNDNPADEPPNEVDRDAAENDQLMRDPKSLDEKRRKAERQRQ